MPARKPSRSSKKKSPSDRETLIRKALALIERRIDEGELNASLADLIRLMELSQAESESQGPIEVRWVDPEK